MKKIKFNYLLLALTFTLLGILIWNFFDRLSFSDSSINFEGKGKKEKLFSDSSIVQKIYSQENNLNQINVSINKFDADFGEKIMLEIKDEYCEKTIARSKIDMFTWQSPGYQKFKFPVIPNSKDKTFCLNLTYIPFSKEQEKKPYISSFESEGSSYVNTGKSIKEQKNRSLELKPAYKKYSFSTLIGRISQYKPDCLKNSNLIITFVLSIILILSLVIVIVSI